MRADEKESYSGGVESYEGTVPAWLMIVYAVLIVWGVYYLAAYWSGY
jgi:hypothetical protein